MPDAVRLSTYCLVAACKSKVGSALRVNAPVKVPPDKRRWLAILVAIVALKVAMAELLFEIDVAIVELTPAILLSNVADVPALA